MLSNMGGPTLFVILFIVLLLFGAPKLPALAKSIGQSMKILKKEVASKEDDESGADAADLTPAAPSAPAAPTVPAAASAAVSAADDELAKAKAEAEAAKAEAEALRAAAEQRAAGENN